MWCDFWKLSARLGAGLPCLTAGSRRWLGWQLLPPRVPRSSRSRRAGDTLPTASPQTWRCTSRTDVGPGDVVSGLVNGDKNFLSFSHTHTSTSVPAGLC